jgi:hypothetical protein
MESIVITIFTLSLRARATELSDLEGRDRGQLVWGIEFIELASKNLRSSRR